MKFLQKNRSAFLIALSAVVIYFSLRLPFLTKIPVFVDEAIYIRWAQVMKAEPSLRFLPLSDGKQPLFMWANMPFFKVFKDPLVAGRMVSVAAGLFALIGIALLTYTLTGSLTTTSLAVLLYSVVPFTVFFDRMALVDSLLAAFGVWSLFLGLLFVKTLRYDVAMLLGFALGFAMLTKSPAVFFYVWQIFLAVFFLKKRDKKSLFKLGFGWFAAFVISQVMYNVLRLGPNFNMVNSRNYDYVYSFSEVLHHPLNPLISNLKTTFSWITVLLTTPVILALIPPFFDKKKRHLATFLLLVSLFALFAQGAVAKVYTSRYILFATVPLLPIAAIGFSQIITRFRNKGYFVLAVLLLTLFVSWRYVSRPVEANMPFDMRNGYLEEWTAGWGQKEIAAYLAGKSAQGQKVIVGTEGFFGTLPDGLQIYTQGLKGITVIGVGWPINKIPGPLNDSFKDPANEVFLVVNQSRMLLKPDELERVKLIASYPKPNRIDGTHETLLFYQVLR